MAGIQEMKRTAEYYFACLNHIRVAVGGGEGDYMETNLFFGYVVDPLSIGGKSAVLLLAVLLSGMIGLERQYHGNAAGLRTHILVCVGSAVMTLTSVEVGLGVRDGMRGDPGRIAAQIVSGIGFLCAGAILREGATVHGLTTAASVWATAGIGIALGASPRLGELAVVAAIIVLATLAALTHLEKLLKIEDRNGTLAVEVQEANDGPARVLAILASVGIRVSGVNSAPGKSALTSGSLDATRLMRIRVHLPPNCDRDRINRLLVGESGVTSFTFE